MVSRKIIPVILSGGSGSRLWPLSRKLLPKQFLQLTNTNHSLLQETILRLRELEVQVEDPIIISNEEHRFLVAEHLRAIGTHKSRIILEPEGKNTAAAVALAAHLVQDKNAILVILPADHEIKDVPAFREAILMAVNYAEKGFLATFGIVPTKPETGYGYIRAGEELDNSKVFKVSEFVEKPDAIRAQAFIEAKDYFWNSGMFVFTAQSYLRELKTFAPNIYQQTERAVVNTAEDLDFIRIDKKAFSACPSDSIDYAVMEHTDLAVMVPVSCAWTDLGSWNSLWDTMEKDASGNVCIGDVMSQKTKDSIVHSDDRLVVTIGMEDCVVVDTKDAVLVSTREHAQDVKSIVSMLKDNQRNEVEHHQRVYRPWGYYESIVESEAYKVKRIKVYPGASLSLQLHHRRSEHWVIVKGKAQVTNGDLLTTLTENQSTYIPVETKHRLHNPTDEELILIEVQCGDYLGEDDIVRYEDTYGRVN